MATSIRYRPSGTGSRPPALLPEVRVINFGLLPTLRVVRVTHKEREIPFIQESRKEDGSFYVIMPDPMAAGQSYEIGMEYDGDKVVRKEGAGNFSVGARTSWYPSLNAFTDHATYDLTFKVPKQHMLVGVGKLVKEWREDRYAASHWVSDVPLAVAGFNYGLYKKKSISDRASNFEIEAYATSEAPDYLRQFNQNLSRPAWRKAPWWMPNTRSADFSPGSGTRPMAGSQSRSSRSSISGNPGRRSFICRSALSSTTHNAGCCWGAARSVSPSSFRRSPVAQEM